MQQQSMMNRPQRPAPTGPHAALYTDAARIQADATFAAATAGQAVRGSDAAAKAAVMLLEELLTRLAELVAKHRKDAPEPEPTVEG